jgi:hypothetical protein
MSTLDPQAFALGFFAVVGLGLLAMYAGIHLRRIHTAQRITDRWHAWNKVNAAYLDAQLADVPPRANAFDAAPTNSRGEPHVCSFPQPCGVVLMERDRQAAQDRLR